MTCKSCNTSYHGKYCSNCGLAKTSERITLKYLAEEVVQAFTSLHKKGLKTIKTSFSNPEIVVREYIDGIRTSYFNPVNFYFLTTGFCGFFTYKYQLNGPKIASGQVSELNTQLTLLNDFIYNHFTLLFILLIPVFSFFSFLMFRKERYNYAEHLTLNLIYFGIGNVIFLLLIPLLLIFGNQDWQLGLELFNFLWLGYLVFAYNRLFDGNKLWISIKCISFYIISLLIIAVISWGCVRLLGNF